MKQFSSTEIISTCSAASYVVADLSRVFHAADSATLQVTHRCTPAPDGMLAVPAVLPTVFDTLTGTCRAPFRSHEWIEVKGAQPKALRAISDHVRSKI